MNTRILLTVIALVCFTQSACAPSLGVRLAVPGLPELKQEDAQGKALERPPVGSAGKVRVATFADARQTSTIATIDGRQIPSDGSLGTVVQEGFERYLRDAGVRVVLSGAPVIEGEITEWSSKIQPKFPASEATAIAKIKIAIKNPRTQFVAYRGTFSGEASMTDPFVTESEIQKLLTDAMSTAIQAILKEDKFMAQLSAVQE
jgi:hypothetical protein